MTKDACVQPPLGRGIVCKNSKAAFSREKNSCVCGKHCGWPYCTKMHVMSQHVVFLCHTPICRLIKHSPQCGKHPLFHSLITPEGPIIRQCACNKYYDNYSVYFGNDFDHTCKHASRRSRTRDTVKQTVCVCIPCNCSTVAMRRKLTASIIGF